MNINFRKIPESFKQWFSDNESNRNSTIDLNLSDEELSIVQDISKENNVDVELTLNYMLMRSVVDLKISEDPTFNFGMLYFDFELYSEDEIAELIDTAKLILIFDEKCEKKSVIISIAEYERLKDFSFNTLG